MARKGQPDRQSPPPAQRTAPPGLPSSLLDTRVFYCGDNLAQLAKHPDSCVDLIYIDPAPVSAVDPPFNSNRNYEVFWGETKEKRAFDDCHASTQRNMISNMELHLYGR